MDRNNGGMAEILDYLISHNCLYAEELLHCVNYADAPKSDPARAEILRGIQAMNRSANCFRAALERLPEQ